MTVMAMRNKLRDVGAIPRNERPKDFPITHFLLARHEVDWHCLGTSSCARMQQNHECSYLKSTVNAAQADNAEEIDRCQKMLKAVQDQMPELEKAEAESKAVRTCGSGE